MTIQRVNPMNPDDLIQMIENGMIWQPVVPREYKDMAIDMLVSGEATYVASIPEAVLDEVNRLRWERARGPIGPDAEEEGPLGA